MGQLQLNEVHIDELLDKIIKAGCRELHLRVGQSPYAGSCHGDQAYGLSEYDLFRPMDLQQMVYGILTDKQIHQFERAGELNFSYPLALNAEFGVRFVRFKSNVEADFHAILPMDPVNLSDD